MRTFSRLALASGGALLLSFISIPLVSAQESEDPATVPATAETTTTATAADAPAAAKERAQKIKTEAKAKAAELKAAAEARKAAAKADASTKLAAAKLAVCEKRKTTITALMSRVGDRGQKQLELVDTIVSRVETFKTEKNLTVEDYATLKAEVDARKAAVGTAIEATKATQVEFACDGSDPKGAASTFKEGMKNQNEAIKSYRDAAIKLLVAVKQSQQAADDTEGEI